MKNIIGVSFGYHDSACCLLKEGELIAFSQEERFTRIKGDCSVPVNAFKYCLEEGNLNITDIDCIAFYENPYLKLTRQMWMNSLNDVSETRMLSLAERFIDIHWVENEIRDKFGYDGSLEYVSHHMSHAASSYLFSEYSESAILTVDSVGEWDCLAIGYAEKNEIVLTETNDFPDSIGMLYSTLTSYLGFKVNGGEYKVMGLAPYGKAIYVDKIYELIESHENGEFKLDMDYFSFLHKDQQYSKKLEEHFGRDARISESELEPFHMDIAKSLQVVTEELLLEKVNYVYTLYPYKNLCMAGGIALNCVAIGKLKENGPYENIFVFPAAGDSGTAAGAAAYVYAKETNKKIKPLEHAFLGPDYKNEEIQSILKETDIHYQDYQENNDSLIEDIALRIDQGQVIGWFQGRMEFGPRALGARSIIADPRDKNMRELINSMVKKRESFRPFAPSVLVEYVSKCFEIDGESPYMLETSQVKSTLALPAITHVDNSARLQTVDKKRNEKYHQLISKFYKMTDCPLVLNTSFNMRGEPIVCTPLDAIRCFVLAKMDALVLGDFVITKEDIPVSWYHHIRIEKKAQPNISHTVYTLI